MLIVFELRPDSTALVVVDMQNDFVRVGAPLEVPDARETIDVHRELLEWFRSRRRPIVFTRFNAGPAPTLMWKWSPVIAPPTRCCWPGIHRTYGDVAGERETVTQICVEDTARGAFHEGFQAAVVSDAVSSYAPELHRASLQTLAMKYGRVVAAHEALAELGA